MTTLLIVALVLQICYPIALVSRERRKARQASIDGRQLVFTGSVWNLLGNWFKWLLLSVVTLGVYLFWVGPRVQKWIWDHTHVGPSEPGSTPHPWPAPRSETAS